MPRLGWRTIVMIIAAIEISDGRLDQLFQIYIIETIHSDDIKLPARRRIFSPRKRAHTAMLAKHMMNFFRLIMQQRFLARNKPKRLRRHYRAPHPRLGAHLAVALEGARTEVNIRLKANRAAMTTSSIGPFHRISSRYQPRSSRILFFKSTSSPQPSPPLHEGEGVEAVISR
jgi:hypothetical protein